MTSFIHFFVPILAGIEALVIAAMLSRRQPMRVMWGKLMDSLTGEREKIAALQDDNAVLRNQIKFMDARLVECAAQNQRLIEQLETSSREKKAKKQFSRS